MFRHPLNFDKWYSVQDIDGFAPPPLHFKTCTFNLPPIKQDPEYSPVRNIITLPVVTLISTYPSRGDLSTGWYILPQQQCDSPHVHW